MNEGSEPRVDYERRVFVTRDGVELKLARVSAIILERLNADQSGKPKPPLVEVKIAGKHTRQESNPDDPEFKEALESWNRERSTQVVKYVFTHGVENEPPEAFLEEHREYFPEATRRDLKYLWVASLVDQVPTDVSKLVEAITGQTLVTQEGLETAMQSFPSDGRRDGSETVPTG